jgi:hypothetical protein
LDRRPHPGDRGRPRTEHQCPAAAGVAGLEGEQRRYRFDIIAIVAKLAGNIAPFDITEVAHPAHEFLANLIVVRGSRSDVSDARGLGRLLSARRERPRGRRAAECDQQFPPSNGDCHTPLPREVRKWNDTTPRAWSLFHAGTAAEAVARDASALLGLDVGRPDDLTPLLGLFRDVLAEVSG